MALALALALVAAELATSPNLARLASAGRLLVVVLDKSQAPTTYSQRAFAVRVWALQGRPEDVEAVKTTVAAVKSMVKDLRIDMQRLLAALPTIAAHSE